MTLEMILMKMIGKVTVIEKIAITEVAPRMRQNDDASLSTRITILFVLFDSSSMIELLFSNENKPSLQAYITEGSIMILLKMLF